MNDCPPRLSFYLLTFPLRLLLLLLLMLLPKKTLQLLLSSLRMPGKFFSFNLLFVWFGNQFPKFQLLSQALFWQFFCRGRICDSPVVLLLHYRLWPGRFYLTHSLVAEYLFPVLLCFVAFFLLLVCVFPFWSRWCPLQGSLFQCLYQCSLVFRWTPTNAGAHTPSI